MTLDRLWGRRQVSQTPEPGVLNRTARFQSAAIERICKERFRLTYELRESLEKSPVIGCTSSPLRLLARHMALVPTAWKTNLHSRKLASSLLDLLAKSHLEMQWWSSGMRSVAVAERTSAYTPLIEILQLAARQESVLALTGDISRSGSPESFAQIRRELAD